MRIFFSFCDRSFRMMKSFGVIPFVQIWLLPKIICNAKLRGSLKHNAVLSYLSKKYVDIFKKYQAAAFPKDILSSNCPIWICWFQGIDKAPALIQKCTESVIKNAGEHPVIFLTKDNYSEYCSIPNYIIEKVRNKTITLTHFSDILRNALLSQKGGIWLDASIYLTEPYKLYDLPYQTIKQNKADDGKFVSAYRWTGFCQAGVKGNPLNSFVYEMFLAYHKREKELIDYYLIDYFMALGYKKIEVIKEILDKVPFNNENLYYMQINMLKTYHREAFSLVKERTGIFKLNQRVSTKDSGSMFCKLLENEI